MKKLNNFPYQHVLVLGLAKSGEAAAQLLYDSKVTFTINDLTPLENNEIAKYFQSLGVPVVTGEHPISLLDDVDLVVKNPGIPYNNPIVKEALKRNIPIITEVELSYYLFNGTLIGITGSNGKTTTTTLIFELLNEAKLHPVIAGNIGQVATNVARTQKDGQPIVMELSSFQLKAIKKFKPNISILLNLTEAHLDFHETMEDYLDSKLNITKNQTESDVVIYNFEEEKIKSNVLTKPIKKLPFSTKQYLRDGVSLKDNKIYYKDEVIIERQQIALPGNHNLENVLAAIAVSKVMDVPNEVIKNVLKSFTGVKHRLQFVKELNGRKFYNDSKATNILATIKAIEAFNEPTVLIAGGLDRGNEYDELFQHFNNVKSCVVYGESSEKLVEAARRNGFNKIEKVNNLEQATILAYENSEKGDIILLSPACASWDQFSSFEERGDMFIQFVHKLK